MGSFEPARAVLLKIVVLSTLYALIRASCTLRLSDGGTTAAVMCNCLAEVATKRRPPRLG